MQERLGTVVCKFGGGIPESKLALEHSVGGSRSQNLS